MGLDGVELVMAWEEAFGISIPDSDAPQMHTVRDAFDWIEARVEARPLGPCRTRRAFHRIRRVLGEELAVSRAAIRPGTRLTDILPPAGLPPERWKRVAERLGPGWILSRVDWPGDVLSALVGVRRPRRLRTRRATQTVGDTARDVAAYDADLRPAPGQPWSREAVALLVRRVTIEELGEWGFGDDARFAEDLGV